MLGYIYSVTRNAVPIAVASRHAVRHGTASRMGPHAVCVMHSWRGITPLQRMRACAARSHANARARCRAVMHEIVQYAYIVS